MDATKISEILEPGSISLRDERELNVRAKFWKTLRKAASQFPQSQEIIASYYCALDPKTPGKVRGILLAALAYFILPIDMVPDFLPMIGYSDDMAVFTAAIAMVQSNITDGHRQAAKNALDGDDNSKPSDLV